MAVLLAREAADLIKQVNKSNQIMGVFSARRRVIDNPFCIDPHKSTQR